MRIWQMSSIRVLDQEEALTSITGTDGVMAGVINVNKKLAAKEMKEVEIKLKKYLSGNEKKLCK